MLGVLAIEGSARAEPRELAWDLDVDGPLALVGSASWFATISLRETIGPSACGWCATNSFDVGARDALRWKDPIAAQDLRIAFVREDLESESIAKKRCVARVIGVTVREKNAREIAR